MKLSEKKDFALTRICLALAGLIFIVLSMRTGDNSQSYLTMGLAFVALANIKTVGKTVCGKRIQRSKEKWTK